MLIGSDSVISGLASIQDPDIIVIESHFQQASLRWDGNSFNETLSLVPYEDPGADVHLTYTISNNKVMTNLDPNEPLYVSNGDIIAITMESYGEELWRLSATHDMFDRSFEDGHYLLQVTANAGSEGAIHLQSLSGEQTTFNLYVQ